MANVIKIKRSTVQGKVPLAGDLEVGELAVNTADGALYTKHSDNTVKQISANLATVTLDYTVTNGNTTSKPVTFSNTISSTSTTTGAVIVTGGLGLGGNINVGGNIFVTGDILPAANNVSNIGSPTNRFNTLFVSANTIDIGGAKITATESGNIRFETRTGNLTLTDNIYSLLSNVATVDGAAGPSSIRFTVPGVVYATNYFYSGNGQPVGSGVSGGGETSASRNIVNGNVTLGSDTTLVDSVSATGNTSVKWTLTASDPVAGNYKFATIDAIHNNANVFYNEYAVILSNPANEVAVFASNISGGQIRLYAIGERPGISVTFQRITLGSSTTSGGAAVEYLTAATGYTGSQGSSGAVGYTGSQGSSGTTGYTGSQGEQGSSGSVGYTGSQGEQGTSGTTGYTGSQGSAGSTGYTGSQGEQGTTGYTGSAATSIIGYSGSEGGGAIGGNLYVPGTTTINGNIVPAANVTYSLGTSEYRFKDLYLAGNTIYLGNTVFSSNSVLPFNLTIAPEVLTIQVDATEPGDDVRWFWTWETSTLPYARTQITNSPQISVPLYRLGTYTVNNFAANELHGNLTEVHKGYFKWIEGAGTQNLISWAVDQGNVNVSHPSINGGAVTSVQRYLVSVPSTITVPTLNTHTANYTVSFANVGAYTFSDDAYGDNPTLGPMYRGGTYTFTLNSSIANHPFYLTTDNGTGFVSNAYVGEYTTGVTGTRANGQPGFNTLTFTVANTAPSTLYYQCGVHSSMRGAIRIKDLAVDVNVNGNYVVYFQHTHEGHSTPIELRPIPSLVNQMCLVYDATIGQFVPQDLATYVENTPSFKNKIQEVAGTATLIAPDGVPVVPTVSIVEDASYLPFVGNKDGDISYAEDTATLYVWDNNTWNNTKAQTAVGYTGSAGAGYTGSQGTTGFTGSQGAIGYTGSAGTFSGTTADQIITSNTTVSTSTATGALQVAGGAGVGGNVYVGENIYAAGYFYSNGSPLSTGGGAGSTGYTGSSGDVGYTGSASTVVGYTGSSGLTVKTLDYTGTLAVGNGTKKWWINRSYTITRVLGFVDTAPTGAALNIRVNKNGVSAGTFSISAGATSVATVTSISVVQGDYITVDITQVGSTVAGSDLALIFEYL